jgi:hypothetical protein
VSDVSAVGLVAKRGGPLDLRRVSSDYPRIGLTHDRRNEHDNRDVFCPLPWREGFINLGVNRTKVRKVSQDFLIICHINMLGARQILGFVAFPSTFGGHLFFATHCQT